jgi:hypothetical protein
MFPPCRCAACDQFECECAELVRAPGIVTENETLRLTVRDVEKERTAERDARRKRAEESAVSSVIIAYEERDNAIAARREAEAARDVAIARAEAAERQAEVSLGDVTDLLDKRQKDVRKIEELHRRAQKAEGQVQRVPSLREGYKRAIEAGRRDRWRLAKAWKGHYYEACEALVKAGADDVTPGGCTRRLTDLIPRVLQQRDEAVERGKTLAAALLPLAHAAHWTPLRPRIAEAIKVALDAMLTFNGKHWPDEERPPVWEHQDECSDCYAEGVENLCASCESHRKERAEAIAAYDVKKARGVS